MNLEYSEGRKAELEAGLKQGAESTGTYFPQRPNAPPQYRNSTGNVSLPDINQKVGMPMGSGRSGPKTSAAMYPAGGYPGLA